MDASLRQAIDELANQIIVEKKISIPITDIESIINIAFRGTVNKISELSMDSDGYIKKDDTSFIITIPKNQSQNRKNFTIAHELGHLYLHMGFQTPDWTKHDDVIFNRLGTSEEEYEANEFAASFLMPEKKYQEIINENLFKNQVNIEAVANYFNVSVIAATNRGKWLGILQW